MAFHDEVQDAIAQAMRGLNPDERRIAGQSKWEIKPIPSRADYAAVSADPHDRMLGLYTPPNQVTLFEQNIRAEGLPAWVVVEHEMTHVLGQSHAMQACGIGLGDIVPGSHDNCPICRMYAEVTLAAGLLEDLAEAAAGQGTIPIGLGGTIPQARMHLLTAQTLLLQDVGRMLPDRRGQIQDLRQCIQHTLMLIADHVTVPQVIPAAQRARECRRSAYLLTGAYWARLHTAPVPVA